MCVLCQSWTLTPGCLEVRGQWSRLQFFTAKPVQLVLQLSSMCMPALLTSPPPPNMKYGNILPIPSPGFTAGMKLKLITRYHRILKSPWDTGLWDNSFLTNLRTLLAPDIRFCGYYCQEQVKIFLHREAEMSVWQLESRLSGGVKKNDRFNISSMNISQWEADTAAGPLLIIITDSGSGEEFLIASGTGHQSFCWVF